MSMCILFLPSWEKSLLPEEKPKRKRSFVMSASEVMTILILFHSSHYRNFKNYYTQYIPSVLGREFPKRVSYNRFVELSQSVLITLCAYIHVEFPAIAFIDSTPIRVCDNKRIPRHKTFKGEAQRGKYGMVLWI